VGVVVGGGVGLMEGETDGSKVGTGEGLAVLGINVGLPLGVEETGAYEVGFELRDGNDVASTG